ncbi:uncharacterized protein LOC144908005 [Branchiostoma floridae x Branchiostoma belcheri]
MGAIWRLQGVPHLARHMGVMCQCHVVAIATVLLLSTRWGCAQVTLSPSAGQPDAATSSQVLQPSPTATMHTYSTERTVSSPSLAYSSSSGLHMEASTSDLILKTISSNTVQSSSTTQMSASVTASAFRSTTILPSEQSVSYSSSISHQSSVSHQSLVSGQSLVSSQSLVSHQSLVSSQSSVPHQSLISSQSSVSPYNSASTVLNQTAVMPKAGTLESSTSVISTAGFTTISSMEQTSAFIQPTPTIISTDRSALRTSESFLYPSPSLNVASTPLSASVNPPLSTEVLPSSVRLVESSNSSLLPTPPTSSDALLSSSEFRFSNDSDKGLMPSSRRYSIEPTASLTSTISPRSSTILSFNTSVAVSSPIFTSSVGLSSTLHLSSTAVPVSSTELVPSSFTSRLSSSEVTLAVPTPSQTSPVATTTAMTASSSSVTLGPSSVVVVTSSVAMVMSSSVNGTGGGVQAPAGSGGLPLAVLVGIVIACCVFVTICVVLMILLCFKRGGAYGAGSKKPSPANGGLWDDGVTLSYINSHIELPKEQGEEMKSLEGETDDPTPAAFTNYGYTDEANTVSTRL